jgi:hypothetical protein
MPRRRSLARRRPIVVYRVDADSDARSVTIKAFLANEMGRIINTKRTEAVATITDFDGPYPRGQWIESTETDDIHALADDVRDGIFAVDDALREAWR